MNLFAKNIAPLKPILKQKSVQSEKSVMFYEALGRITIGASLYPNPELVLPIAVSESISNVISVFTTPTRETKRAEDDSQFKKPS